MEEKQLMYCLKSLKENTFFVREFSRQKGLETQEIFKSWYKLPVLYDQCDNSTVPSWWDNTHVKGVGRFLIIQRILNVFETKQGIIKILFIVLSLIINQINVIFFAIITTLYN